MAAVSSPVASREYSPIPSPPPSREHSPTPSAVSDQEHSPAPSPAASKEHSPAPSPASSRETSPTPPTTVGMRINPNIHFPTRDIKELPNCSDRVKAHAYRTAAQVFKILSISTAVGGLTVVGGLIVGNYFSYCIASKAIAVLGIGGALGGIAAIVTTVAGAVLCGLLSSIAHNCGNVIFNKENTQRYQNLNIDNIKKPIELSTEKKEELIAACTRCPRQHLEIAFDLIMNSITKRFTRLSKTQDLPFTFIDCRQVLIQIKRNMKTHTDLNHKGSLKQILGAALELNEENEALKTAVINFLKEEKPELALTPEVKDALLSVGYDEIANQLSTEEQPMEVADVETIVNCSADEALHAAIDEMMEALTNDPDVFFSGREFDSNDRFWEYRVQV